VPAKVIIGGLDVEIKLSKEYVITSDKYQYILQKETGNVDKKGNPVRNVLGYYGNLNHLIRQLLELKVRTSDVQNFTDLHGKLEAFVEDILNELRRNHND